MDNYDDRFANCNHIEIYKMKNENNKPVGCSIKYSKCNNIFLYNHKHDDSLFQSRTNDFNCIGNDNFTNHTNN